MKNALGEKFPKLMLQTTQLPTGEWTITSPSKPLTEEEAEKVVSAYQRFRSWWHEHQNRSGDRRRVRGETYFSSRASHEEQANGRHRN